MNLCVSLLIAYVLFVAGVDRTENQVSSDDSKFDEAQCNNCLIVYLPSMYLNVFVVYCIWSILNYIHI